MTVRGISHDHLISNDELQHRVDMRRTLEGKRRIKCKRCRSNIPLTRKHTAEFCSNTCKNRFNWDKITALRCEVTTFVRESKTVPRCTECDVEIDDRVRHGPVPTMCNRCRGTRNQRAYRAAKKRLEQQQQQSSKE